MRRPDIGRNDICVRQDLRGCAGREQTSRVDDIEPLGKRAHEIEVVLDQEHGRACIAGDLRDNARQGGPYENSKIQRSPRGRRSFSPPGVRPS